MIKIHTKTGFTIIELMTAVVIIGLLATLTTVIISKNQQRARDARRVEDVTSINEALKLYYQQKYSYPHEDDDCQINGSQEIYDTSNCDNRGDWTGDSGQLNIKKELVENGYMKSLPVDPINRYQFQYYYEPFAAMADDCKIAECVQMLVGAVLDNPQNGGQAFCRIDNDNLDINWKNWCDNL